MVDPTNSLARCIVEQSGDRRRRFATWIENEKPKEVIPVDEIPNDAVRTNRKFFEKGLGRHEILDKLDDYRSGDIVWNDPQNLKAAYFAGDEVSQISWEAHSAYQSGNLLYGNLLFPSLPNMSEDVVGKALEMLNAGDRAHGTFTGGGTESIILAVRAAREWARDHRTIAGKPEIVIPQTGHAAFNKAADLLDLSVIRVPVDTEFRADPGSIANTISENTIMIVGSAPAYPIGSVDPIADLAAIARANGIWMHVDACVGGFFLPFAIDMGEPVPAFDFSVDGVRSISLDLHKYGYTSRGASLLMLCDRELVKYQKFEFSDWPTGEFITTTLAGSRPGGVVASAWAVMNFLGYSGYRERVGKIIAARKHLAARIEKTECGRVLGRPLAGILGIGGVEPTDMKTVRQAMMQRGWKFGALIDPVGMNLLLNYTHGSIVEQFVSDFEASVRDANTGKIVAGHEDESYGS